MNILFSNERLKNLANSQASLQRKYGSREAKAIKKRLNDLKSFESLQDIPPRPPFRRHKLKGNFEGCFAVDVLNKKHPLRIVFYPTDESGNKLFKYELKDVRTIKIIYMDNYH